jgi:predicted  nucleic acid-binding Zn-ribbon protein
MEKQGEDMQRLWTRNQSELVALINSLEDLNEQHAQMKSEFTVLHQKEMRLETQLKSHVSDMKDLDRDVQKVHLEIGRAGALISKNEGSQATLAEEIFALETELQESLKELETEDARLAAQTEETREKKMTLLDEIVEAEYVQHVSHPSLLSARSCFFFSFLTMEKWKNGC